MSYKGYFKPKNPHKYKGNAKNIIYRSSLELRMMNFLDNHPSVVSWQSEELFVPYRSPKDKKVHRYFPDFIIEIKTADDQLITEMIEVKPSIQTKEPVVKKTQKGKVTKASLRDILIWAINQAKWDAAKQYCINKNWKFRIITEKDLKL
jgi:hypothetical protein